MASARATQAVRPAVQQAVSSPALQSLKVGGAEIFTASSSTSRLHGCSKQYSNPCMVAMMMTGAAASRCMMDCPQPRPPLPRGRIVGVQAGRVHGVAHPQIHNQQSQGQPTRVSSFATCQKLPMLLRLVPKLRPAANAQAVRQTSDGCTHLGRPVLAAPPMPRLFQSPTPLLHSSTVPSCHHCAPGKLPDNFHGCMRAAVGCKPGIMSGLLQVL